MPKMELHRRLSKSSWRQAVLFGVQRAPSRAVLTCGSTTALLRFKLPLHWHICRQLWHKHTGREDTPSSPVLKSEIILGQCSNSGANTSAAAMFSSLFVFLCHWDWVCYDNPSHCCLCSTCTISCNRHLPLCISWRGGCESEASLADTAVHSHLSETSTFKSLVCHCSGTFMKWRCSAFTWYPSAMIPGILPSAGSTSTFLSLIFPVVCVANGKKLQTQQNYCILIQLQTFMWSQNSATDFWPSSLVYVWDYAAWVINILVSNLRTRLLIKYEPWLLTKVQSLLSSQHSMTYVLSIHLTYHMYVMQLLTNTSCCHCAYTIE